MIILVELGMFCFILVHVALKIQSYKQVCRENGLSPKKFDIDIQKRWNSTYLMLWSIVDYKEVLMSWVDIHFVEPSIALDRFDFFVARLMIDFLEVFYEATNALFVVLLLYFLYFSS